MNIQHISYTPAWVAWLVTRRSAELSVRGFDDWLAEDVSNVGEANINEVESLYEMFLIN